ncbi:MAG: trigger factor [Coriobacteriia bacterium]|nr:trigger factor [Coriobacteriia bacterium]
MKVIDKIRETDEDAQELVLTIEASAQEVDKTIKAFLKELNQREHEGFRKGKAPREVLENSVGGHAKAMGGVAEKLINEKGFEVVDNEGVIYLSEPEFNVEVQPEDGKPFQFTVSGVVKPELELTSYDPVTIEMPPDKATDAEVERQIQNLREYYYTLEVAEADYAAERGDFVNVQLTLETENGIPVRGFNDVKRMIELGASTMPQEFTAALLGCKAGEQHTFTFDASAEEGYSHLGSGPVTANAEVLDVRKKILPPLDDDLAIKSGAVDVADLYKMVRININKDKREQLPRVMEDRALVAASQRLAEDIPGYYMTFVRGRVQNEFMDRLQKDGSNLQDFLLNNGVDGEKFQKDIADQAIYRATRDLTLDAIYRHNCEEVTQADLEAYFSGTDDVEDMLKSWKEAHHESNLRETVARAKASSWLVDTAEVTVVED